MRKPTLSGARRRPTAAVGTPRLVLDLTCDHRLVPARSRCACGGRLRPAAWRQMRRCAAIVAGPSAATVGTAPTGRPSCRRRASGPRHQGRPSPSATSSSLTPRRQPCPTYLGQTLARRGDRHQRCGPSLLGDRPVQRPPCRPSSRGPGTQAPPGVRRTHRQTPVAAALPDHVTYVVSKGPISVPDVVGDEATTVTATLLAAELTVGQVTQVFHAGDPVGYVISQAPVAAPPCPGRGAVRREQGSGQVPDIVGGRGSPVPTRLTASLDRRPDHQASTRRPVCTSSPPGRGQRRGPGPAVASS